MNITVVGFGHFAGVVASCLAEKGHAVDQVDESPHMLRKGQMEAKDEPGFWPYHVTAIPEPDLVWVAYDCPLDEHGAPLAGEILRRIVRLHERTNPATLFVVSCQWPVGAFAELEHRCAGRDLVYVLENVRAGKAMEDFRRQPAIIVGARNLSFANARKHETLELLLFQFAGCIRWMTPESAEMAKHTTNAFMALQIAFANEIARVASMVGATPSDVMLAVRCDARVSPLAPLEPGQPFGGGSLKRDLLVLDGVIMAHEIWAPILQSILPSNEGGL